MGFIIRTIYYVVLIVNPIGRILVRGKKFSKQSRDSVPPYLQSTVIDYRIYSGPTRNILRSHGYFLY